MSRGDFPSAKQDQFVLRLPDGMRDRIKAAAEDNKRSMNAEIVATLTETYPEPVSHEEALEQMVKNLEEVDAAIESRLGQIMSNQDQDVPKRVFLELDALIPHARELRKDFRLHLDEMKQKQARRD